MQTSINLASQPYVNLQGIKRRWMTISAVVVSLTLILGIWTGLVLRRQKDLDSQIKTLQKSCDQLNGEIAKVQEKLQDRNNVDLIEQSEFLNDIILRKSFSWTEVFEELEQIMPAHVQVQQIQPELLANHELQMHLTVTGNRDGLGVIELLSRLEKSKDFTKQELKSETANDNKTTTFVINAIYIGGQAELAKESASTDSGNKGDKAEKNDKSNKDNKNNKNEKPAQTEKKAAKRA